MKSINLKGQSGIYKTTNIIDAFLIKDANLSVVLSFNDETESGLFKIYISKYVDNKLMSVTDEEWSKIKEAMANIISSKEAYELLSLPSVIDQGGILKPCLIKTFKHFEDHYENKKNDLSEEKKPDEEKIKFTSSLNEIKNIEPIKEDSISFLAQKAKEELDAEKNENSESVSNDTIVEGKDYKEQKENLIKIVSRSVDDMLEIKNKEIVRLNDTIDSLETELRKNELEKKQALNVINLYHEKIRKLNDAIKGQKEE